MFILKEVLFVKEFKIKESDVKAIIGYLQKKPYEEVYQGIEMLLKLEEIKVDVK